MDARALVLLAIKASIVLMVLSVGLQASAADALSLVRDPARLARSIVAMLILMPVVATLLALGFHLKPPVAVALVALSLSPVPPIWPRRLLRLGGDETLTVGLLAASAVASIVILPLALSLLERVVRLPIPVPVAGVARLALATVLLPLAAGIVLRRIAPGAALQWARGLARLATLVLAAGAVVILFRTWSHMTRLIGDGTLAAMAAFILVGLAAGHALGGPVWAKHPDRPEQPEASHRTGRAERQVLALATSSRHPAIALTIARGVADDRLVPAAIVLYLILSALVTTPYVVWIRRSGNGPSRAGAARGTGGVVGSETRRGRGGR